MQQQQHNKNNFTLPTIIAYGSIILDIFFQTEKYSFTNLLKESSRDFNLCILASQQINQKMRRKDPAYTFLLI